MNNSEFINEMSARLQLPAKEMQRFANALCGAMVSALENGDEVAINGFGTFETKQKAERVIVHPATGKKILVPPKQVLNFKQASALKEQAKGAKLQPENEV